MSVTEEDVVAFIATLPGLDVLEAKTTRFFYYDPQRDIPHDKRQPFVTVMSADDWDTVSNLARPGAFRVNIGVSRETYRRLLGPEPAWGKDGGVVETGRDFTELDAWLPHPYYAPMGWICILNPSDAKWPQLQAFIREAHAIVKRAHERQAATT